MSQTLYAANLSELKDALNSAKGGETIRLKGGDWGNVKLWHGKDGTAQFASEVTLVSDDPDDPAVFSRLYLRDAGNLTLDGITFDYTYQDGDDTYVRPFQVYNGTNVTIRNSTFDGDVASNQSADADGYGFGIGVTIRKSAGITFEDNLVKGFFRGTQMFEIDDLKVTGNEVTDMRSDMMNYSAITNGLIADNYLHDIRASAGSGDHTDMIQFWTANTTTPTTDVLITRNTIDIGNGSFGHSIFMRNEMVDMGKAGAEMYYRNITITDNMITNGHVHGINVGESDGLRIANNTILHGDGGSPDGTDGLIELPRIRVNVVSKNVTIEKNITHDITGYEGQSSWVVKNNLLAQDQSRFAANHYDDLFVTSTMDDGNSGFLIRPGSALDVAGIGASVNHAKADGVPDLLFTADATGAAPGEIRLQVVTGADALPAGTVYVWTFADGTQKQGAAVTHAFATSGSQDVTLKALLPDGTTINADATLRIADSHILSLSAEGALTAYEMGEAISLIEAETPAPAPQILAATALFAPAAISLPKGIDLTGSGTSLTIAREHVQDVLFTDTFDITLRLRADTAQSHGEVMRLHGSFQMTVSESGGVTVQAFQQDGKRLTLSSDAIDVNDLRSHVLSFRQQDGQLELWGDGVRLDSVALSAPLVSEGKHAMMFGTPWKAAFAGTLETFDITVGATMGQGVSAPAPQPDTQPEPDPAPEPQPEPQPDPAPSGDTDKDKDTGKGKGPDKETGGSSDTGSDKSPGKTPGKPDGQDKDSPARPPKAAGADDDDGPALQMQKDGRFLASDNGTLVRIDTQNTADAANGLAFDKKGVAARIDSAHLAEMFDADGFEISMTLQADDGMPTGIGEVLRMNGSFIVQVMHTGDLVVRAFGEDGSITRIMARDAGLTDGDAHDVTLRYQDKVFHVLIDGAVAGQAEMTAALGSRPGETLKFGNPWGANNFRGAVTEFELNDSPAPLPAAAKAAMSLVEIAPDPGWFDLADTPGPAPEMVDSFDFNDLAAAADAPVPSYGTDSLFDGV